MKEMSNDKADITLVVMRTNAVRYDHWVNDPFFSAHQPLLEANDNHENHTSYTSDHPFAAIGCQVQVGGGIPYARGNAYTCNSINIATPAPRSRTIAQALGRYQDHRAGNLILELATLSYHYSNC